VDTLLSFTFYFIGVNLRRQSWKLSETTVYYYCSV